MSTSLTIGQLARKAKIGIETIRFYERKGLIEEPPRRPSGYRMFPPETVDRILFILRAKELGFTLREIKELLDLRVTPGSSCKDVRRQAERKIAEIERKQAMLSAMHRSLEQLIAECKGRRPLSDCPIIQALNPKEDRS